MPKLDIEHPKYCPFKKETYKKYDTVGPNYTPVVALEIEHFTICIGEECMLYLYDQCTDTEQCLLGR